MGDEVGGVLEVGGGRRCEGNGSRIEVGEVEVEVVELLGETGTGDDVVALPVGRAVLGEGSGGPVERLGSGHPLVKAPRSEVEGYPRHKSYLAWQQQVAV